MTDEELYERVKELERKLKILTEAYNIHWHNCTELPDHGNATYGPKQ